MRKFKRAQTKTQKESKIPPAPWMEFLELK